MKKYISLLTVCVLLSVVALAHDDDKDKKAYGDNLIHISPFVGHATPQISDVGVGIAYERFVNDYISVKLPVNFGLSTNLFQTGLGMKFYPAGHRRPVKYAVGPTLLFGRGNAIDYISQYDSLNNYWFETEVENPVTQVGFMLTNSVNMTIQKNIYIGAEMGLGLNYLNDYKYDNQTNFFIDEDPNVLFQFNISMGYRF